MTPSPTLRELWAKATPGEWSLAYGVNVMAGDGYSATNLASNLIDSVERNEANAALIVAAVNALPALLDAADELAALKARIAWQPIETAPKDGTMILAYFVNDHWPSVVGTMQWTDFNGGGWVHYPNGKPTRWQPLPAPPAAG